MKQMSNIVELQDNYDKLVELGVVFYYESYCVPQGEITDIKFGSDDIQIQIDEDEWYDISYEEFQENHSKEGNNYHTWSISRHFDKLIQ